MTQRLLFQNVTTSTANNPRQQQLNTARIQHQAHLLSIPSPLPTLFMLFRPPPGLTLARRAVRRIPSTPLYSTRNQPRFLSHTPHRLSQPMAAQTDTDASLAAASSGVTPATLSATLKDKIHATHVEVEDMSGGCGQAFNAIIVSAEFEKKTLLARHRLVNNALKAEIAAIHAWTPRCLTPEQWEKEKAKMGAS